MRLAPRAPCTRRRFTTASSSATVISGFARHDPYLPVPMTKRGTRSRCTCLFSRKLAVERDPILVREFIHDCLYNPGYGYFAQKHTIFSAPSPIEFNKVNGAQPRLTFFSTEFNQTKANIYRFLKSTTSRTNHRG